MKNKDFKYHLKKIQESQARQIQIQKLYNELIIEDLIKNNNRKNQDEKLKKIPKKKRGRKPDKIKRKEEIANNVLRMFVIKKEKGYPIKAIEIEYNGKIYKYKTMLRLAKHVYHKLLSEINGNDFENNE